MIVGALGGVFFTLVHLRTFHPIVTTHPTYVFHLLANDMHIIGFASNVLHVFFVIIGKFWSIKTFNITDEVCSLVSIGVRLVYITSSRFSCT
jgi:hypothetical protein